MSDSWGMNTKEKEVEYVNLREPFVLSCHAALNLAPCRGLSYVQGWL